MAIFSIIKSEGRVQIGEKFRIDAVGSFVTKGASDITTLTVRPEADISAISVFDTNLDSRVLDWVFSDFEIDIDATNNKLNFEETSGTELTATLTTATYTLSAFAAEIKTQLDSAGAGTYTVSFDSKDRITIASTVTFSLLKSTGTNRTNSILETIGFLFESDLDDTQFNTTFTGKRTRWLTRTITVETGDGSNTQSETRQVKVYSKNGDALFSSDADLISHEPDIINWLPAGKSTFNFVHREAQELIIAWLDENGYVDVFADKFDINDFIDPEEARQWSKFMVLRIIFQGISNAVDDIHNDKRKVYKGLESEHRNRAVLRIDIDDDGKVDTFEDIHVGTGRIFRR